MLGGLILLGPLLAGSAYGHNVSAQGKAVNASSQFPTGLWLATLQLSGPKFKTDKYEQTLAWFNLDLEEDVISPDVTFYFRTDDPTRRNRTRIALSNVSHSLTDFCYIVNCSADGSDIADVFTFNCDSRGQYLTISTVTSRPGVGIVLEFAEVQVHACSKYTYGPACESECHCVDEPCDWRLENPVCSSGCMPGWKSSACDTLISASDVRFSPECNNKMTFTLESIPRSTLTEMEVLSGETQDSCLKVCYRLILCLAFEISDSICTLWRTGSTGLSQSRDMWKKKL